MSPTRKSRTDCCWTPRPASVSGYWTASSLAIRARSAEASAPLTPARIRPTPPNAGFSRVTQFGFGPDVAGSQISVGPKGSWKSAAVTPITWCGSPFSTSVRPSIPESAPKRDAQTAWDSTTTRAPVPAAVSWSLNSRPIMVRAPSRRSRLAVTKVPESRSGPSPPVRFTLWLRMTPMSSKVRFRARYSSRSG